MPLVPRRVLRTFRYVMFFDGVDDYVVVRHSPVLDVQPGNTITVIMIANFLGWRTGFPVGVPIDKREERRGNYNWEYTSSTMVMRIHGQDIVRSVFVPHSLGVWNHYAMVLNGSWLGGYLNGVLRASRGDAPSTRGSTAGLYIGSNIWRDHNILGYIAQVLIYSRALSSSEILWNYQHHDSPVRDGLVLWLQADPSYVKDIDGDGVPEWLDLSGFGNHGKVYGATLRQIVLSPARALTPARVLTVAR